MARRTVHLCPVCNCEITRTENGHIAGHYDKARNPCPGSYSAFTIAITANRRPRLPEGQMFNAPKGKRR